MIWVYLWVFFKLFFFSSSLFSVETKGISWQDSKVSHIQSWKEIKADVDRIVPDFIKQGLREKEQVFIPLFLNEKRVRDDVRRFPSVFKSSLSYGGGVHMRYDSKKVYLTLSIKSPSFSLARARDVFSNHKNMILEQILKGILQNYYYIYKGSLNSSEMKSLKLFLEYMNSNEFSPLALGKKETTLSFQFAINVHKLLTDSQFSCRRPYVYSLINRVFSQISYHWKTPYPPCENLNTVVYSHDGYRVEMNFNRIYEIHYLLASKGEGIGRFGHSMIRVVMCKSGQKKSEDCVKDITDDVIINFRAFVNGVMLNPLVGLGWSLFSNKKYPSQLMVYNLPETKSEYNFEEGRTLKSYPIKMSEEQKRDLLKASLEVYWAYQGGYAFFFNNCAIESAHLINFVFPDKKFSRTYNHTFHSIAPHLSDNPNGKETYAGLSPFSVLRDMKKVKIIREDVDMKKEGFYFFPNYDDNLNTCLNKIYSLNFLNENLKEAQDYRSLKKNFKNLGAEKRRSLLELLVDSLLLSNDEKLKMLRCFQMLEYDLQNKWEMGYVKSQDYLILGLSESKDINLDVDLTLKKDGEERKISLKSWLNDYIEKKKAIHTPSQFLKKDLLEKPYGVPLEFEIDVEKFKEHSEKITSLLEDIDSFYDYIYEGTKDVAHDEGLLSFINQQGLSGEMFLGSVKKYKEWAESKRNSREIRKQLRRLKAKECEQFKKNLKGSDNIDDQTADKIKHCDYILNNF